MVLDKFNRPLTGIRISITQKCNLDCIYCHSEGESEKTYLEMTIDEIIKILQISVKFGINRVKFTGGEPLLREDLPEIIRATKKISAIKDVSLVTNGILLEKYAQQLCATGLNRINVSLDTLNPGLYERITCHDGVLVQQVIRGIQAALNCGIAPIKINMVLLKHINETEVADLLAFTKGRNLILQLIELVPTDNLKIFKQYHAPLDEIEDELKERTKDIKVREDQNRKKYYLLNDTEVEVVKPVHNSKFCANCHRIRITSTGMIKPCLMRNDNLVDILTPLRHKASDDELYELFQQAINRREPYCK